MVLSPPHGTRIRPNNPLLIGAPNLRFVDAIGLDTKSGGGDSLVKLGTSASVDVAPSQPFLPPLWSRPLNPTDRASPTVRLELFSERHLDAFISWITDPEYRRYHSEEPLTRSELLVRLREGYYFTTSEKGMFIIEAADGTPLGWVNYRKEGGIGFDAYELGILIGQAKDRGKGIGPPSLSMLIDYLFHTYQTERIQARVLEHNPKSLRLCEKVGFYQEGRLRSVFCLDGRMLDAFMLSITRPEWLEKRRGAARESPNQFESPRSIASHDPSLVRLVPLSASHADAYLSWIRSPDYRLYYPEEPPSRELVLSRIEGGHYQASHDNGTFIVESANSSAPLGWVSYTRDRGYEAYELSLFLPDTTEDRVMDAAAFTALVDHLFQTYEIRRVQIRVLEDNSRALALCKKMGLRYEARLLKAFPRSDHVFDALVFGVLKDEWITRS